MRNKRPSDRDGVILTVCCIIIGVILWMLFMESAAYADWNDCESLEVQQQMWDYLTDRFDGNAIAAAAIMGNAGCESNYCPWRYCGDNTVEEGYHESRAYVDQCSETQFVFCWMYTYPPGWGLFQFSTNAHMQAIWDRAEEAGVPVYDVELQCDYMCDNLEAKRPEVYAYLLACTDLVDATEVFRSFGVGSTFTERSVRHRIHRALDAFERFSGDSYQGEIYMPAWNGGSLHALKG